MGGSHCAMIHGAQSLSACASTWERNKVAHIQHLASRPKGFLCASLIAVIELYGFKSVEGSTLPLRPLSTLDVFLLCMMKSDGGAAYSSKLDDFEAFVARSKLSALQLQPSTAEQQGQLSQASQSQTGHQVSRASFREKH